jgi:hypothetical protein
MSITAKIKLLFWRIGLTYHLRRLGLSKRRLSALPAVWKHTGQECWQIYYEAGETPIGAIYEDSSYAD